MKKTLPILAILTLYSSACTNPLETDFYQAPEVIILNAMLRTDDTVHFALVSRGLTDDVLPAPDAQLRCYINGTLTAEGTCVPQENEYHTSRFEFPARIQPGDEVRLEAVDGSLRASATVTAPEAAPLVAVDTAYVEDGHYGHSSGIRCKLQLQDLPNQDNWYRLSVQYKRDRSDDFRNKYEVHLQDPLNFGFLEDPILRDGYSTESERSNDLTQMFSGTTATNAYCSFKDAPFADGSAEVEIYLPDVDCSRYSINYGYDPETDSVVQFTTYLTASLKFTLLTITKEEYDYLTQLNKSLHSSVNLGVLQEPIHIPGNVEGGHGFVSVASASTQVITLPFRFGATNL